MKNKKNIMLSGIFLFSFCVLTICLLFANVRYTGIKNEKIGLFFINKLSLKLEYNAFLDKLSDVFLLFSIVGVFALALKGFIQLIKRKSLFKVDRSLICFGCVFLALVLLWLCFDKLFVINNRPILIDNKLEASYPSTHIMLATFTLLSLSEQFENKRKKYFFIFSIISIVATVVLRFISGMHWITDCLGGLFLGVSLYFLYLFLKEKSI